MSLQRIKESILNETNKEAEKIIEEAKERFNENVINEKTRIEEAFNEKYAIFSKQLEEDKKRGLSIQRTNYNMELLGIKNNMIEGVFKKAVDKFISDEEYWNTMEKWLRDINESVRIFMNARDSKRLDQEFINRIKKENKHTGQDVDLIVDEKNIDIKGGFILKTAKYEIDRTLDTILCNLRTEIAPLMARELFGE